MGYDSIFKEVLQQYNFYVAHIEPHSSFYLLDTDKGKKILRTWNDIDTLKSAFHYREGLAYSGFRQTDRFIRTTDGMGFVELENQGFSVTDWIEGKYPSVSNDEDLRIIGKTIAYFHSALLNTKPNQSFESWSAHYHRGLNHFQSIYETLTEKRNKEKIDEIVLEHLPKWINQIKASIQMAIKVEKITSQNEQGPIWCHGNLRLNSFKIDPYQEGWLLDIAIPILEFPSYDVAKLLSRLYLNNDFLPEKLNLILNHYQEMISLRTEDKLRILTYIAYPHDLWKFLYVSYIAKVPNLQVNLEQYFKEITVTQARNKELYQSLYHYFGL